MKGIKAFINSNTEKNNNLGKRGNTFVFQRERNIPATILKAQWITILDSIFLEVMLAITSGYSKTKRKITRPSDYSALYPIHE